MINIHNFYITQLKNNYPFRLIEQIKEHHQSNTVNMKKHSTNLILFQYSKIKCSKKNQ